MSSESQVQLVNGRYLDDGVTTGASKVPKRKRTYHHKVRTGCLTCKIRRVRCDEEKPACKRCTSTGRTCDGYLNTKPVLVARDSSNDLSAKRRVSPDLQYATSATYAGRGPGMAPESVGGDARLLLPKLDPSELRSYRYYVEVVGPSLSGFFDADFWLVEVLRVCHSDASIWHAIVSLGATYECQRDPKALSSLSRFALQQFNSAIHCLMEPNSPRHADRGRALTVSTIFAGISSIQGQHKQAAMHVEGGCKMLQELEGDELNPVTKNNQNLKKTLTELESLPIAIAPMRNILMKIDLMHKALQHGGVAGVMPTSQVMKNSIFRVWRSYEAPQPSKGVHSTLTPEDIIMASRAGESLMNGLVFAMQQQVEDMAQLMLGQGDRRNEIHRINVSQRPHARAYKELKKALAVFEHELNKEHCGSARASRTALRNGTTPLKMFLAICRMIFLTDPEEPDPVKRAMNYPNLCHEIIADAETVWSMDDTYIDMGGRSIPLTPKSTILDALFMVAIGGSSIRVRRRAAARMRSMHTKPEGLFHTVMAANLADLVTTREIAAYQTWLRQQRLKQSEASEDGSGASDQEPPDIGEIDEDTSVPPPHRLRNMSMDFPGTKKARVRLQTWREYAAGEPGVFLMMDW
ncbi:uncharacterized protein F5Z01DRAFT_643240 [Emericellopsis atlantica]|uniref:Zn(2)-C6 fungal-type domain-containing protein n=1 Tax=Emericellopsis atlantica TaxID=2614577 RepID=A0A9P7ZVE2_9HYPO|nr:uncharacterized protein F5Z01DRAFT_643240 [Emericellopsis atlantica]KAG9258452.1 hypothetical protein F5Z01DRAFT_643240 [Emericellopsis atlantica]